MIERYSREKMKKIWDLESNFKYYLNVEQHLRKWIDSY